MFQINHESKILRISILNLHNVTLKEIYFNANNRLRYEEKRRTVNKVNYEIRLSHILVNLLAQTSIERKKNNNMSRVIFNNLKT
jgi:hypothetical protein